MLKITLYFDVGSLVCSLYCSKRQAESKAVAHKIYGVPITINSANYAYFLAYQHMFHVIPSERISAINGLSASLSEGVDIKKCEPNYKLYFKDGTFMRQAISTLCCRNSKTFLQIGSSMDATKLNLDQAVLTDLLARKTSMLPNTIR